MITTTLVVGLVAGLLATVLVRGSGSGVLGDIVLGVAGAFVGGWVFQQLGWGAPLGLAGVIAIATAGAVILLLVMRLFQRLTVTR